MKYLKSEVKDDIGIICFDNDDKRNSLNSDMLNEIIEVLGEMKEKKVRVLIIRANRGVKVWSAGFDINELPQPGRDPLSYYDPLEKVLREIQDFPAPVIAMIEGSVWGGACDIAFICDILIGTKSVSFAITPAKIGVPYNPSGIMHFINMIGVHLAKEMFFTAMPINAEKSEQYGILNHLVENPDELEAFTFALAEQIKKNSPLTISVIKEQIRILSSSYLLTTETFERIQGLRRKVYDSSDFIEGIIAFHEKRPPKFTGE